LRPRNPRQPSPQHARFHFSLVTPWAIVTFIIIQPTPIPAGSSRAVFVRFASPDAEAARCARGFEFGVVQVGDSSLARRLCGEREAAFGRGLEFEINHGLAE
jgi:hypothetical protein